MSPVEFKKRAYLPVEFKGQGPHNNGFMREVSCPTTH